jgi:hypothetical protein
MILSKYLITRINNPLLFNALDNKLTETLSDTLDIHVSNKLTFKIYNVIYSINNLTMH